MNLERYSDRKKQKIAIFDDPTLIIGCPLSSVSVPTRIGITLYNYSLTKYSLCATFPPLIVNWPMGLSSFKF